MPVRYLKQKLIKESFAFQPIFAYLPANLPKKVDNPHLCRECEYHGEKYFGSMYFTEVRKILI
jgi:hypothetical protein